MADAEDLKIHIQRFFTLSFCYSRRAFRFSIYGAKPTFIHAGRTGPKAAKKTSKVAQKVAQQRTPDAQDRVPEKKALGTRYAVLCYFVLLSRADSIPCLLRFHMGNDQFEHVLGVPFVPE